MNSSVEEVLKSLPDFDDFMKLTEEISVLNHKKLSLEAKIKFGESEIFRKAMSVEGKPPSIAYIENTLKYPGIDKELLLVRAELIDVTSELDKKRLQMEVYKIMVDIWRSLSANTRRANLE